MGGVDDIGLNLVDVVELVVCVLNWIMVKLMVWYVELVAGC